MGNRAGFPNAVGTKSVTGSTPNKFSTKIDSPMVNTQHKLKRVHGVVDSDDDLILNHVQLMTEVGGCLFFKIESRTYTLTRADLVASKSDVLAPGDVGVLALSLNRAAKLGIV